MSDRIKTNNKFQVSLYRFFDAMSTVLFSKASVKGYGKDGTDKKELYEFVEKNFHGHSLGEIVYKAVRYENKKDPEDLVKMAAWAFLLYDMNTVIEDKQETGFAAGIGGQIAQDFTSPAQDSAEPIKTDQPYSISEAQSVIATHKMDEYHRNIMRYLVGEIKKLRMKEKW